jgi:hypothetical protein
MRKWISFLAALGLFLMSFAWRGNLAHANGGLSTLHPMEVALQPLVMPEDLPRFIIHSDLQFEKPDTVRGIYVTAYSAAGDRMKKLIDLVDKTDLNAMVIDIKDDYGNITIDLPKDSPLYADSSHIIKDPKALLKILQAHHIYPIARIVVFKDSVLAKKHPELSFKDGNTLWKNGNGDAFVSPFSKDVWNYNLEIAKVAAKLGFQEIQFDYVRFPEGFEKRADQLSYNYGEYKNLNLSAEKKRVKAVTDFVTYAKNELKNYDVKMSVDIFGYTATLLEAGGIGQNFTQISQNVDVISPMIYPSHWTSYFGIQYPDKHPYELVSEYAKFENKKLAAIPNSPVPRPWIQDFTATWLGAGHYIQYGKTQVEAQIKALKDNGINEFLIWDAGNSYTPNVDYTP